MVVGPIPPEILTSWAHTGLLVQTAGIFTFPSPGVYPARRRDHWNCSWLLAGRLVISHAGGGFEQRAGEVCLYPPDLGFSEIVEDRQPPAQRLVIDFATFQRPGTASPFGLLPLPRALAIPVSPDRFITAMTDHFLKFRPRHPGAGVMLRSALEEILLAYTAALFAGGIEPLSQAASPWLAAVEAAIERHLRDPDLDLTELARLAGCSVWHLAHRYRSLRGLTVKTALRRRRLCHALYLLQNNRTMAIGDIAERCGYRSASLLARHCRREYGGTPRSMRCPQGERGTGRRRAPGPQA